MTLTTPSASQSPVTPYLLLIIFITTLGPLQFGYHLSTPLANGKPNPFFSTAKAELNAPKDVITCLKKSITSKGQGETSRLPQCIPMNEFQFGIVSSSYTLGGLLGALVAGPFSTKYGRLLALRATTIFFILGPIAETLATGIESLSAGRLISGIGAGAAIVVGPIYIAEVVHVKQRGFFGAFTQVMTNVGILLSQSLGYFLSRDSLWRIILAVAGAIGALELLGLFLVPESPIWLAEHQRPAHARRILQRIRGKNNDIEPEVKAWRVSPGETEIGTAEEESLLTPPAGNLPPKRPPISMLGAIANPTYQPAIIAVIAVMAAQQFTGINSIVMYSVSILSDILPTTAPLLAVVISALNLIVTLLCAPLADKFGRKPCLLLSITGMGLNSMLLALGIAFNFQILSAIATLLFVASFAVGLGPVPFILASELVGPEAVGATQSWALGANWSCTFVVAQFFPPLNVAMGEKGRIYWVFTALAVVLGSFLAWWLPETKGKSTMEEVWGRREERRVD